MGNFGERLQREREMRGITLEEIAEATKIGTRSLRALEEQDFDKLPGGIFNKGFVRAYSKYLGIDEDQSVADYMTAVTEAQSAGKLSRPDFPPPSTEEDSEKSEPIRIPWGLLIIIAFIAVVGFSARSYYAQHGWAKFKRHATPVSKSPQPVAAVASDPVAAQRTIDAAQKQPVPATTPDPISTAAPVNPSVAADAFVVKVRALKESWVWIKADGKIVLNETLKANADHSVRAKKEVILVTGNAGGIEISHNDKLLPPIGPDNQKKTIVLTARGEQIQP